MVGIHFRFWVNGVESYSYREKPNGWRGKDLRLLARNMLLDRIFYILARGGKLEENPIVEVAIVIRKKKGYPIEQCKKYIFNRSEVAKCLKPEIEEAWATGEEDPNVDIEQEWGSLDENHDLKKIIETMTL